MTNESNAARSQNMPLDPELKPAEPGASARAAGHDGVVGEAETDPDRRDLRSEIGKYVSLASFPALAEELVAVAAANGAPDSVLEPLHGLDPGASFATTRDLWSALDLETKERF